MPLNSPEDYELLGEHLTEIDSVLEQFARAAGFSILRWQAGGRYPHRWLSMGAGDSGAVQRAIQITMDTDEHDQRFDRFFPDIPYTIYGGAWIDDFKALRRTISPKLVIDGIPFSRLVPQLRHYLNYFRNYVTSIRRDFLLSCGHYSRLARRPADL